MSNISGKLNLMQLKAAIRKMNGANGPIDCIVIPIEANHLFRGEQGVYLDLIAFESKTKNEKIKDTHLVKQSLPKEVLELMSDEERKSQPIIFQFLIGTIKSFFAKITLLLLQISIPHRYD